MLGLARALVEDLPETLAALERGDINGHRAQIIVTESQDLCRDDRARLDSELAGGLSCLGDRDVQLATQRLVLRLDAAGALVRRRRAEHRRCVTSRHLPDGMALITAVVSDVHHAAILGSLGARASAEIAVGLAHGDDRTRTQVVADLFVTRLTGQITAQAVPVRIDLVVSAETVLGGDDEPAQVLGHGSIPGSVALAMVLASPAHQTRIRRLFRFEDTDRLVTMESTSRTFDGLLADVIRIRDQRCRTVWCRAPIRHLDHVQGVAAAGPGTEGNAQGLCEACNYLKETPDWSHVSVGEPFDPHEVEITTPTGHRHRSRSPGLLGRPARGGSPLEIFVTDLVLVA
ncbi:MAG: 13E12 repeat family protein [Nocardioides sp.]|nr:13E12 repeat family protein [Nocardioides sp.]